MNIIKRIIAAMMLMTVLVLSLASCNGGGGNDKPSNNNGLIGSKYIDSKSSFYSWRGTNGEEDFTFDGYKDASYFAEWNRVSHFNIGIKNYAEINGTPLKKVKFDIVADRNVTVYFACGYNGYNSPIAGSVALSANQNKRVELSLDLTIDTQETLWVYFMRTNRGEVGQDYMTPAFAEWYQTQYQITNLELYSK